MSQLGTLLPHSKKASRRYFLLTHSGEDVEKLVVGASLLLLLLLLLLRLLNEGEGREDREIHRGSLERKGKGEAGRKIRS